MSPKVTYPIGTFAKVRKGAVGRFSMWSDTIAEVSFSYVTKLGKKEPYRIYRLIHPTTSDCSGEFREEELEALSPEEAKQAKKVVSKEFKKTIKETPLCERKNAKK